MKLSKVFTLSLTVIGAVLLWGILFLHPLVVFSQDDAGGETAVSPLLPTDSPKLNEPLRAHITDSDPDDLIRYIVYMTEAVDSQELVATIADEALRHVVLVEQLQKTAGQSQKALLSDLDSQQQTGNVKSYRSLWIINAVAVEGTVASLNELATRADVAEIRLDEARPLVSPPEPAKDLATLWTTAQSASVPEQAWGIEAIRAPHVWQGLGIDGTDVTVGIMDSGVDWLHPDLLPNYRGNIGGSYEHTGNWFDAVVPTMTVPHDVLGHGTHVAGTAVGQNGIGVAPGASWIAVNIANSFGNIYHSDAHVAFQWLLAPNGDPTLAPDVVNGSWSGLSTETAFLPDIQALEAAGIILVFAAGNNGPDAGSIGAPASYTETIAVGAHDDVNQVAWFSSRGASPWHTAYTPQLVAPGTRIYSSLRNGDYGYNNGTSMAAPHTTGAVALLLSANNSLSRQDIVQVLTETAVSIAPVHPNMDSGWGRLDVYQAVGHVLPHSTLTGIVSAEGQPQAGVVLTLTNNSGETLRFVTDENGRYQAPLSPETYHLTTAPFGYTATTVNNIALTLNTTTTQNIALARLPSGTLSVQVLDGTTSQPVHALVEIEGTPFTLETNNQGMLEILLPTGNYEMRVRKTGYTINTQPIAITQNVTSTPIVALNTTEKVLLVDTGAWYYQSYRNYFEQSLTNLGYAYDTHVITTPVTPAFPAQALINEYDVLVWTSPTDSPGYIYANEVITDFLGQGGNLFISGQNIGSHDGYSFYTQIWWYRDLQAKWLGETAVTHTITGANQTPYEGLTVTLNGAESANNQSGIDVSRPRPNTLTQETFFADGDSVGLQAGRCKPFRISYLGFGLEGVAEANDRDAIMSQAFSYFKTPQAETGLLWRPNAISDYAPPNDELVYVVDMQHLGELITDTYTLQVDASSWPVSLNTTSVTLGPCANETITVTVQVPATLPRDFDHDFAITAVSQHNPAVQISLPIHHKTPGRILLVDDDRWYDQTEIYRAALTDAGFVYDEWDTRANENMNVSPSLAVLNAYDFVIWFTGYDWFAPITEEENKTLTAYLAQGGRLFLSSQDFLYYHHNTPLAKTYLGVMDYQESITPTQIYRANQAMPAYLQEPMPLTFTDFQNNSDGITPNSHAAPFVWHDQGMVGGVSNSQIISEETAVYRSIFFGFPFEKLPANARAPIMNGIVGWLSDLGESSFAVDQRHSSGNAPRTFTITLRNNPAAPHHHVQLTNTLPVSLTLLPNTLTGGSSYHAGSRQIRWQGTLDSGDQQTITYEAHPPTALPTGTQLDNVVTLAYDDHHISFDRTATFWTNAPDLSASVLTATQTMAAPNQYVTYTLAIANTAVTPANQVTATFKLPSYLTIDDDTTTHALGNIAQSVQELVWTGSVPPGETITVTVHTHRLIDLSDPEWITAVAYLDDGITNPTVVSDIRHLPPFKHYFPVIAQNP